MPIYVLFLSAELRNLTNLEPLGGCNNPNLIFEMKVECLCCGALRTVIRTPWSSGATIQHASPPPSGATIQHASPWPSGATIQHTNDTVKSANCQKNGTIRIRPGHGSPLTEAMSKLKSSAILMVFECKGLFPVEFVSTNPYRAETVSGKEFIFDEVQESYVSSFEIGDRSIEVEVTGMKTYFKLRKNINRLSFEDSVWKWMVQDIKQMYGIDVSEEICSTRLRAAVTRLKKAMQCKESEWEMRELWLTVTEHGYVHFEKKITKVFLEEICGTELIREEIGYSDHETARTEYAASFEKYLKAVLRKAKAKVVRFEKMLQKLHRATRTGPLTYHVARDMELQDD